MRITKDEIIESSRIPTSKSFVGKLYASTLPKVRAFVSKNGGSSSEGDDVFHDAILGLYESCFKNKVDTIDNLEAYIFQACKFVWYNKIRKDKHLDFKENAKLKHVGDDNILSVMYKKEQQSAFAELLARLGQKCKDIIHYSIYEKKSMEELAALMGFSNANAAKTQNYRCKKLLGDIIGKDPELALRLKM